MCSEELHTKIERLVIIMAENTRNLADFGMRELEELRDILSAWIENGLPDDFYDEGVVPEFNPDSGYVFLTNDDNQVVCLTDDGKLESWYYTSYYGHEGFFDDLVAEVENGDWDLDDSGEREDVEQLIDIANDRGDTDVAERLQELLDSAESTDDEDEE